MFERGLPSGETAPRPARSNSPVGCTRPEPSVPGPTRDSSPPWIVKRLRRRILVSLSHSVRHGPGQLGAGPRGPRSPPGRRAHQVLVGLRVPHSTQTDLPASHPRWRTHPAVTRHEGSRLDGRSVRWSGDVHARRPAGSALRVDGLTEEHVRSIPLRVPPRGRPRRSPSPRVPRHPRRTDSWHKGPESARFGTPIGPARPSPQRPRIPRS